MKADRLAVKLLLLQRYFRGYKGADFDIGILKQAVEDSKEVENE